MKTTLFKQLPLSLAVGTLLVAQTTWAQETITKTNDEASVAQLDNLQVTADRQGAKVKTNVVTTRLKDERTETDLRGLLKEEPAIAIGGGNGTSQFVTIRGMGQNSIDLKIDNAYTDSQFLYHQGRFMLDPALVKIVSVQKGAGAASAGIGATNGAIVTKTLDVQDLLKGSQRDYGFKVNAGYNSNKGMAYGLSAFGRAGNFDFLLSGNRVDEDDYQGGDGYVNPQGVNTVPFSALDKLGFLAKAGVNLGDHRFVLSHMRQQHEGVRTVREEFIVDDNPGSRLTSQRQFPQDRKTIQDNTNLEWTAHNLGFVSGLTANVYHINNLRISADDSGNGYAGSVAGETKNSFNTTGANINFDTDMNDSTLVKYGVNYRQQETVPHKRMSATDLTTVTVKNPAYDASKGESKDNPKEIQQQIPYGIDIVNQEKQDIGAYFEAISELGDFTVTLGGRYDYFKFTAMDGKQVARGAFNPSLAVFWQPMDSLSLNANYSHATRSPRMYDTLLAAGHRGITSIANNISSERARNAEIGFNYDKGGFSANGSYFYQRVNDALGNFAQNRHGQMRYTQISNVGYMTNKGYELGASYRHKGITARIGVSDSKPQMHGVLLSGNPEFAIPVGRTWTGSLAYRFNQPNLEVGVRNRTVEKTERNVLVHNPAPQNREGYSVSDIYANWKPLAGDVLNINLAVNNVMNKNYRPHSQRAAVTTPTGAGRDFRIAVNYKF